MTKRNIAKEVLAGLDDFAAWRAGEPELSDGDHRSAVCRRRREDPQWPGSSQTAFAAFMGVSVGTLRNWEQLRREPQGPARAFLHVASAQPLAVLAAFERRGTRPAARSIGEPSARRTGSQRGTNRGAARVP